MTNPIHSSCPKCGAPIPENAPQGLCPKCVLAGAATLPEPQGSPAGRTPAPTIAELAPHFPELEILEVIGVGGMGAVYKARQPKLDRLVALKILSHDLAADPAFTERFNREARVLARLSHPNIVTVFDCGMAGPFAYLLMEFVDGVNLRQAMQTGRFKPAEALALVQDVCGALKFAHEKDILHRDIKPENILIDSRGQVKIADFGIAKLVGENEHGNVTLTLQGAVLGSPRYMAPEQFDSPGDVDQRADIYSLGVVLYEMLTGELPMGRFAPPSQKSAVDARIDEIVMRTLERERELRFQTIGEVKTRVEDVTNSGGPRPQANRAEPTGEAPSQETACFATASAVWTGISLLLGTVSSAYVFMLLEMSKRSGIIPGALYLIIAVGSILTAVPAIRGAVLGSRAWKAIRESAGRKGGFTRATLAVLIWPAILALLIAGVGITGLFERSIWDKGLGLLLVATGALGVVMIHRIYQWAKSSPTAASPRIHVRRFIGAAIVVLVCLVTSLRFAPADSRWSKSRASYAASSDETGIELKSKMMVAAGKMMTFRLVRIDARGNETPVEIGGTIYAPEDRDFQTTLSIIVKDPKKDDADRMRELTASCELLRGAYLKTVSFEADWTFVTSGKGSHQLLEDQKDRFELATRKNWLGKKVETLYLETVGVPQKTSDGAANPSASTEKKAGVEKQP